MKKLLRMICLTLALCMLAGCGAGGAQPTPSGAFRQTGETVEPATAQELAACQLAAADYPDYPQRPGMEDYTDSQGSMDMDAYDAAMSAYQGALAKLGKLSAKPDIPAVRDFAADTSLRLLAGETENAVYSPVSLYLTLAMLADLSGGDTSQQVRQLLNLQDPEALRQQVQQLWMALYCDNGITTCRLAGSAWVAQGSTVHQAALDSLAGVHRCGVYQAAMGTQEANRAIAAWLDQQTGGLLQGDTGSIRTSPMELLRLYSTVYFKDGWLQEFAKEDTYPQKFRPASGSAVTADFMHREDDAARYLRGRGYQAASLPLQGNMQMIVALPDQGRSTADLLSRQGLLEELTSMEDRHCVRWSVPKFDVHSSMDLAELLQDMGVTDAFDKSKADFSPLSDEAAVLAGVMQATRVKVDEDGVEGAAYTEAIVDLTCAEAPGAKPVEMCLDRPFVFVVATSDGIPLFVGTVQSV